MSGFLLELRTGSNKRYSIIGFIVGLNQRDYQYPEYVRRTTVAIIPPGKRLDGVATKLWGYDQIRKPQATGGNDEPLAN